MGASKSKKIPVETASTHNAASRSSVNTLIARDIMDYNLSSNRTATQNYSGQNSRSPFDQTGLFTYRSYNTTAPTQSANSGSSRIGYSSLNASSSSTPTIRQSTTATSPAQTNLIPCSSYTSSSSTAIGRTAGVPARSTNPGITRNGLTYRSLNTTSSSTSAFGRTTILPTIDQNEEADINIAIQRSLRDDNNANRMSANTSSLVSSLKSTQHRKSNIANVKLAKIPTNTSTSKAEMTFDCSICLEFKDNDVIVATECGHVFHKNCVSPWILQQGTCPSCRVRVTIPSLRTIFVSVSSNGNASTSNAIDSRENRDNIKNNNNNNGGNRRRTNPKTSAILPTMFSRTIWLSSQNTEMDERSLATVIMQLFRIPSDKFSIKSLRKAGTTQQRLQYVSFKISVDSENTFYTLNNNSGWPNTYRVREFIELNRRN